MDHHKLADVFGGNEADKATVAVHDGQSGAGAFVHALEGFFEGGRVLDKGEVGAHELGGWGGGAVVFHGADEVVTGEEAEEAAVWRDDGEFVLAGAQEGFDGMVESGVGGQVNQMSDHGIGHRHAAGEVFHFGVGGFLLSGEEDEECDEDEHGVAEEACEAEEDSKALTDSGGDGGGFGVGEIHRQKGTEDAASIHWERGDEIEKNQPDVDGSEFGQQSGAGVIELLPFFEASGLAENSDEEDRDEHIDEWASKSDDELLPRVVGHSLEAGHAADGEEGDVRSLDAERSGGKSVAEFVKEDAEEEGADEDEAVDRLGDATCEVITEANPCEEKEKSEVKLDLDAGDSGDYEGSGHGM